MKTRISSCLPLSTLACSLTILVLALAVPVPAQDGTAQPLGLPQDWSYRHLIYSNPETQDEAMANGTLDQWNRNANDPRFLIQLEKKQEAAAAAQGMAVGGKAAALENNGIAVQAAAVKKKKPKPSPTPGPEIHRDWSNVMGGVSGAGASRTYPAKFSFAISGKSCANDFVVFTTAQGGATSSGTFYSQPGTFTNPPLAGETIAITNALYTVNPQTLTLTADASVNTGLRFAVGASATDAATNLANAIARNGGTVGVTATAAGGVVTITSITTAIANANINTTEGLSNFTLGAETAGTGTKGQPTIFALNQLYPDTVANGGCQTPTQAVPATFWSYNTGTGAIADLSPVLSFFDNGAQVAFTQRVGTAASLVLLKWSSSSPGTVGVPTTPTSVTAANYRACTAPCMVTLSLGADDNDSSTFVDYANDTLYVGDDTGRLHKFTGVFQGTPQEAGTPWPVTVTTGNVLSSPVFDSASQLIFIGSNCAANTTNCNRLHSVSTGGTVVSSGTIGSGSVSLTTPSGGNGVRDAPIVDSTGQRVYAFIGADNGATDSLGNACSANCNAVYQFVTTSSLATQNAGLGAGLGAKVIVGLSGNQNDLQRAINSGAFDDAYHATGSGSLYVCGSQPATARLYTLWKITLSSFSFTARTVGPQINNANGPDNCSPVTVFKNGASEFLYASVATGGFAPGGGGCTNTTNGCAYAFQLPLAAGFDTTSAGSTLDGTTRFASVSTSVALNTNEASVQTTLSAAQAGTYGAMTITQSAASPAGTTFTYTLRKNGGNTAITCGVGAGVATCSDTTHTASYVAGDTIDVQVQRTVGTGTLTNRTVRVQLESGAIGALNAAGGTGGIVIDNTATGGGSQVYYSTRTSPGIAVQATQTGLQ